MIRRACCGECLEESLHDAGMVGEAVEGRYFGVYCPHCGAEALAAYPDLPTGPRDEGSTSYRERRVPASLVELG